MSLATIWSNRLEILAEALEASLLSDHCRTPAELLGQRTCVIVPNRIQQIWLQQHFLYQTTERNLPRVVANCDFPLLHIFVNDCLHRMDHPAGLRQATSHPFSSASLRWRIFAALQTPTTMQAPAFAAIRRYIASFNNPADAASLRRLFLLATRLADMFDEYCVYRPEMLWRWEKNKYDDLPDELLWQPELWKQLTRGALRDQTYLAAFQRMQTELNHPGVVAPYRRVRVFGPAMMPRVYLVFFDLLSACVPVEFFLFNPSQTEWFSPPPPRETLRMEGLPDDDELLDTPCRLLAELGRGSREFVAEVLDITAGQAEAGGRFRDPGSLTILHQLQSQVLHNTQTTGTTASADTSIQVHICHSPLRELEVLRDHAWRWFAEIRGLQPRDIQVQVTDLSLYAPYIDTVFSGHRAEPATIPYSIADRAPTGANRIVTTLQDMLCLADSRFTAPEMLALLRCQPLARKFGFDETTLPALAEWITAAGIRWGCDSSHRRELAGVDFTDATSWRHGLDRLLLGFAVGHTPLAESETHIVPADCVEGDDAERLGQLVCFFDCLTETARVFRMEAKIDTWVERLTRMITTFFHETDETYRETAMLRDAISALQIQTEAAGFTGTMPLEIIRAGLATQLQNLTESSSLNDNAMIFNALRPGSSSPRRIMCVLGMGDGRFPRADNRPAYDLMRQRRMGDRSPAIEDRTAWLETLMNARDVFYISFTGRSDMDNQPIPPSVLVQELSENVIRVGGRPAWQPIIHRLQAFHPDYFTNNREYFSYSTPNCRAAAALLDSADCGRTASDIPCACPPPDSIIEMGELALFFKNPAAWFYHNILGADLEPPCEAALPDSEEFAPAGLTAYTVNQQILATLLSNDNRAVDDLPQRLAAAAGIPLENWGLRWLTNRMEEIRQLLATEVAGLGLLEELLRQHSATTPIPLEIQIAPEVMITGAAPQAKDNTIITFRCARAKAADRLAAWLRHLLVCACARPAHCYFIAGRKPEELTTISWGPLDSARARDLLQIYTKAFHTGHAAVAPFTPETAWAYAEAWHKSPRKGPEPDPAARRAAGLAAARRAWTPSSEHKFGDAYDPHYRRAFGPSGPFADESAFTDWAARIMFPIFDRKTVHA